jgi:hypothetical protein
VRRLFYGFRYRSEVNLPDFNLVQQVLQSAPIGQTVVGPRKVLCQQVGLLAFLEVVDVNDHLAGGAVFELPFVAQYYSSAVVRVVYDTYVWVSAIEIMDSVGYDPAHRLR